MSDQEPDFDPPKTPQGYTAEDIAKNPTLSQHLLIGLYSGLSTMVDTVTRFGVKVTDLTTATDNVHAEVKLVDKKQTIARRRDRIVFSFAFTILLLVVSFGFFFIRNQSEIVRNNRDQLAILKQATGPAAQRAQKQNTDRVVKQIDCNEEENNRQLLQSVRKAGFAVEVEPESQECAALREGK